MDEKTEELRDIFRDVADDDTVTESQADTHGSLASEREVDERLQDAVETMREDLSFDVPLDDDDDLVTVVKRFYAGDSDADIADELGVDEAAVVDARFDLHLVREDADVAVDLDALRDAPDADPEAVADDLDADPGDVERARRVIDVRDEVRRVNDRYRAEFENALRDRELSERLTATVHEDGLDEATEGQETDMDI